MSNLTFAPGETDISVARFSPTVVLFWLRAEMAVTNRRVVTKVPNTLLGVIPLGYADAAFPLNNVASAGVEVKFSLFRFIFGLLFVLVGAASISKAAAVGVILLLLGVTMLSNALSAALVLVNNGGGRSWVRVSVFERRKLEQFRNQVNDRLFRDNEGLRHLDVMGAHDVHTQLQQQQLRTLQGMQGMPGDRPAPAAAPRAYQVGDVVNGHRFNGVAWVPLQGQPGASPQPPPRY